MFKKATRQQVKLKLAMCGPAGSGKTMSANRLARGLVGSEGKIALIDTENESASLYSDRFDFDVCNVAASEKGDPNAYLKIVRAAIAGGYDCLIIDSFSHVWEAVLSYKDKMDKAGGNSFTNWNTAGQKFKDVLNEVLFAPIHVIVCLRAKTEYVIEQNDKGKAVPRKIGMAPITRDGTEFEFTTIFDLSVEGHYASTSKDRTGLFEDRIFVISEETGSEIGEWLKSGKAPTKAEKPTEFAKADPASEKPLANAKPVENAKPVSASDNITTETLETLEQAWLAGKKSPADVAAACAWVGSAETRFSHLTEAEGQKLLTEVRRQVAKMRTAEDPNDDIPMGDSPTVDLPAEIVSWLDDHAAKVKESMVGWKWITEAQTWRDAPAEKLQSIPARMAIFARSAGIPVLQTANA